MWYLSENGYSILIIQFDISENVYFKIFCFLSRDIFDMKAVKIVVLMNTFFLSLLCLIQTVVFVQKANLNYFIQYGPTYFMALYVKYLMAQFH